MSLRLVRRIGRRLQAFSQDWRHGRSRRVLRRSTGESIRVLAIAGWNFPVYSQTFVYEELIQMINAGFEVRLAYSGGGESWELGSEYSALQASKIGLAHGLQSGSKALERFRDRQPARVDRILNQLAVESGMSPVEIAEHRDVLRGFLLAELAEAHGTQYLHSYFFYEGSLAGYIASELLEIPRGISCYADHLLQDYPLKATRLQLERASVVVATSHRIRRELRELAPQLSEASLLTKPNAVDTRRFPPPFDRILQGPFRLLSVSRIEPKKGLATLLRALGELLNHDRSWILHLVGGPDPGTPGSVQYHRDLLELVITLGLQDHVVFLGPLSRDAVRRRLNRAHLFLAPYEETLRGDKDGIPTSLLEAMASGLPVIATTSGSIPEVVTDSRDGLLVPMGDVKALTRAILRLIGDPGERSRLGETAAKTVRERFDISVCEPRLHQRIRAVVRDSSAGSLDHDRQSQSVEKPCQR